MFQMRKRVFLVEKLIHTLIVLRVFTKNYFGLEVYVSLLLALLFAQYFKEGLTPLVLLLLPIITLQAFGEINESIHMQYLASIVAGIFHFVPLKMYWLPQPLKVVGFRNDVLESDLHYSEFYPLDDTEAITLKSMKWNTGKQLSKMFESIKISNKLLKRILHIIFSYADHHNIKVGQGAQLISDSGIAFSHGKGGTPLFYSSLLMHFAGLKYKIGAPQHTQAIYTNLSNVDQIKKFRQKQVQIRAAELSRAIHKIGKSKMVLMGHSYGCATLIQAYHTLQQEIKRKITHIVLLDPWFYPLTEEKFKEQIKCPILILANEDFVDNQEIFQSNNEYIKLHKVEYIVWKHAHHFHQTDVGFINGNILDACKNSHLSQILMDLNIQAIDKFLRGEKVEGTFNEKDLGRSYVPKKLKPTNYSNY